MEPLTLRLLRLFDASRDITSRGVGVTAALPTLPYRSVRWGAYGFWLSLLSVHGAVVYLALGKTLVSDSLAFLYEYQARPTP